MGALKTVHSAELRGLYANSNRFTTPQGTVPRLSNVYMTRRGAFHTIPGSKWISSWDGLAPHVTNQLAIVNLTWYAPSQGSSADIYMAQFPSVTAHRFLLNLQLIAGPGVELNDASGTTFVELASQLGAISLVPNTAQYADYLAIAFANNVPPNIFPTVTQLTANLGTSDATINVASTTPFANSGFITIDNEIIGYTAKTISTFSGLTRGAYGTTNAAHTTGATVFLAGSATSAALISTVTTAPMASTDTSVAVTSTTPFPPAGVGNVWIAIGGEVMLYAAESPTAFQSITRFAGATSHISGSLVFAVAALGFGTVATQTTLPVSAIATSVTVSNTAPFPPAGYILIDSEAIQYTGKTSTTFTGLTRGVGGTTAATHTAAAIVVQLLTATSATGLVWGPILNTFDPSLIYVVWPGTNNGGTASTSVSVNIGTIIFVEDGAGTLWLFKAQNSGFTAWGPHYFEPQFFPDGLIYSDGVMNSGSPTLTSAIGKFTAALVGQPIVVQGAGADGDLLTTVAAFVSSTVLTLANNAGANVTSATYTIGVGHFGDSVRDFNTFDTTKTNGEGSGTEVWLNIGQAALSPPGTAFVFQHLDSLFLWGVGATYGPDGLTGPDALWQSDTGIPLNFNPANVTFVGKGDGTQAQGGAVYSLSEAGIAATPQLVLFKDASTYSFLNEFPDASLVEVSGGLGCIAPATIQFVGSYGIMRLSYAGVTLFDGQLEHVTEYTDAIRGYLFGGLDGVAPVDFTNIQKCVSSQSVNPPFYMFFAPLVGGSGSATRGFGYDFGLKQWFVVDLPFPITAGAFLPQSVVAIADAYQSLIAGANDGAVRRIFAADPDWDGAPIVWSMQLPDFGFPGTPVYVRRVNPYITAQGGGATPSLTNVSFSGTRRSSHRFTRPLNTPVSILASLDVGEIVLSGNITITGKGQVLIEGSDAQTSDKPTGRVGL